MARKRKKQRRRSRGMGSVITVRRKRGGMGALKGSTGAAIAPLVGGAIASLTAFGIRRYVNPAAGETQRSVVKWAPLFGLGGGILGSMALYFLGGTKSEKMQLAAGSAAAATMASLSIMAYDRMLVSAPMSDAGTAPSSGESAAMSGVVFRQLNGMNAIVPEPTHGMRGLASPYGESISLRGVDTSVFGRTPF